MAYNPDMNASEKSDIGIVPMKVLNKMGRSIAEVLEGRPMTKGNSEEDDCDLYTETGGSIERTRQDTQRLK